MPRLFYYLKVWWVINIKYILPTLTHNWTFAVFLLGKVIRFIAFGAFLFFLLRGTKTLAGYTLNQILFFYLTFFLIDATSQFLFREVYRFRSYVVSGSFDLILLKPVNPLFRVLLGGADAIDFLTLPPLIYLVFHFSSLFSPSLLHTAYYLLLVINSLILSAAFHIAVLAFGIITLEVDHTVMIFRDLESLARFPVDIYRQPIRAVVTYFIPIGLMITLPAKAFLGLISPGGVAASFGFGILAFFLALKFWNFALTKYTSASS